MKEYNRIKIISIFILSVICIMFVIQCNNDDDTVNNVNDNYKEVKLTEDEQAIILNRGQIQRTVNTGENNNEETIYINKDYEIIIYPKNPISEVMTGAYYFINNDENAEPHDLTINFSWKINNISNFYTRIGKNIHMQQKL